MLRTIHLHGRLGKKFGKKFELDVASASEALRALFHQLPGFANYVRHRQYSITVGPGVPLDMEALDLQLGRQRDIHITPAGATSGIETILLAGVLIFSAVAAVSVLSMPKVPSANSREEATKTSSFIFDGATNVTEQGHVVPLIYGRFRVGSVVASSGITTSDVNEGTVANNPVAPGYSGTAGGFGIPIIYNGHIGTLPGLGGSPGGREWVELLKGGKGGGGTARAAQEDPNSLQSQATAKVLDVIGEGEIVGLVDGLKSVYFDETPLQNPDGSYNFAGVSVEQRVGLPDQDFIPGFTQAENTREINTEVTTLLGAVTRSITDQAVTVARVTIRVPQLYKQDTTNGDLKATSVSVKISVQADGGGYTDVHTMTFTGKTNSGYQRSVDIRLPNGVTRNVRVTRITADSAVASVSDETFWDLLTEVVEAKLSYPDTAMIGLTVDARQFGSNIPTRSYDVKGLKVEVPSNYNPVTRVYTGIWDGTFVRAWTDNPAWVLRDIALSKRYGLGNRVSENAPDKWALYEIAKYNDGLVPDGFGGTQPRYTINCVINTPAQAYEVMNSIASNCRAVTYWGSGAIMTTQDRPEDPSFLITPSNIVGGDPSYSRITPVERRRSVAVVYWNDPEDGYRLTPEFYEDPELIRRFGRRGDSTDDAVTAFGVTNRGQAHRMCKWILEDEAPGSNSVVNYQAGDDHGFLEPGRVGVLEDPKFTAARRGGRVRSALANSVQLDAAVTLAAGQAYTLRVMLPDGTTNARTVTNAAGTHTTLNLSGAAYGTPPAAGAVWALESNVVANRQWRIRQMTTDEAPYEVTAILHDPTKYARVELESNIETANFLSLPTGPLQAPTQIEAFEFLFEDGTAAVPSVQVSWDPSQDPRVTFYQAQYRAPGGNWEAFADSIDVARVVRGVAPGTWYFRVRALDSLGRKTQWVEANAVLDGQIDALPSVSGLSVLNDPTALQAMLIWVKPTDRRPLRYEVLFDDAGIFANAISLALVDTQEYVISQPGTYWVRTRFLNAVQASPPSRTVVAADLPDPLFAVNNPNVLTRDKKPLVIASEADRLDRKTKIRARLVDLSLSSVIATLDTAESNWLAYRNGLSPAWNNTALDSPISRATWDSLNSAYAAQLNAADKSISEEDARRSLWSGTVGRPPLITATGLTADETLRDPTAWEYSGTFESDPVGGGRFRVLGGTEGYVRHTFESATPIDHNMTYEGFWELYQSVAVSGALTSRFYTVVRIWDVNGVEISGDGTHWFYPLSYGTLPYGGDWIQLAARFGKGTARPFPANAARFGIGALLNLAPYGVNNTFVRNMKVRPLQSAILRANPEHNWVLGDGLAIRTGGGDVNWNNTAFGKNFVTGPQTATFKPSRVGAPVVAGLTDAAVPGSYADFDGGIYFDGSGNISVIENGSTMTGSLGAYTVDTEVKVEYDGLRIYYHIDGVRQTYSSFAGQNRSFKFALDCYSIKAGVTGLEHGPSRTQAIVGGNTVDANGNQVYLDALRNNMALLDFWRRDATLPPTGWALNAEFNRIISLPTDLAVPAPKAGGNEVWYCEETTGDGNQGGGWDGGQVAPIDKTRTYRFMVPVRRVAGAASTLWGIDGSSVCDLNTTTPNTNPYFCGVGPGSFTADRWYLMVGYVYPAGSTGHTHDQSGIYDCSTGEKVGSGTSYCWRAATSSPVGHRAYQYYAAAAGAKQLFGRPVVNLIDGSEPSLREYFGDTAVLNSEQQWFDVSGIGRPQDYATSSDNMIKNGSMVNGGEDWNAFSSATFSTYGAGSTSPVPAYVNFPPGTGAYIYANREQVMQLEGVRTLFASGYAFKAGALVAMSATVAWYKNDGSPSSITVATTKSIIPAATGAWESFLVDFVAPSDATQFQFNLSCSGSNANFCYAGGIRLSRTEPAADVTSTVTGAADIVIECDHTGAPVAGQPGAPVSPADKVVIYKLFRNGVDVTASAAWSRTVISGTISTTASTGALTITGITSLEAVVRMTAVQGGSSRSMDVKVRKNIAPPPSGGSGGGGGGGTSASDSTFTGTTTSSHVVISDELNVTVGGAGEVALTAPLSFTITTGSSGTYGCFLRWQEWNGSAWVDVGAAEVEAQVYAERYFEEGFGNVSVPGSVTCNVTLTGRSGTKKYRLTARNTGISISTPRYYSGTATAQG